MKQKWIAMSMALLFTATATLTGCGSNKSQTGTTTASQDTAQETSSTQIDQSQAKEICLSDAGVTEDDATFTKIHSDYESGRKIYELEWYAYGNKYEYEIYVSDGEIRSSSIEASSFAPSVKSDSGTENSLSESDAKKIALDRVSGASESDIYEWKQEYDDGISVYEGKIIYDKKEYDFTINASTGEIIEWDVESVYD